jgi:hypothetical protein
MTTLEELPCRDRVFWCERCTGTSCILIKRFVFEGGYRFKFDLSVTPYILFMHQVQRMGFAAKVHGDVLCGHLPEYPIAEAGVDNNNC